MTTSFCRSTSHLTLVPNKARQKGVRLEWTLFPNSRSLAIYSVLVRLDKKKFSQVIHNLLSNAIVFTPPGGSITVTATVRHDHAESSIRALLGSVRPKRLVLEVRDTGAGISQVLSCCMVNLLATFYFSH